MKFKYKRLQDFRFYIDILFSKISFSQESYLLILGGITGVLAGFGAIIFHETINLIKDLFYSFPGKFFNSDSLIGLRSIPAILTLILLPAIGGLLVGIFAYYFEKGEQGEGIPSVMDAVASRSGIIKGTIAIKKIIGTATAALF